MTCNSYCYYLRTTATSCTKTHVPLILTNMPPCHAAVAWVSRFQTIRKRASDIFGWRVSERPSEVMSNCVNSFQSISTLSVAESFASFKHLSMKHSNSFAAMLRDMFACHTSIFWWRSDNSDMWSSSPIFLKMVSSNKSKWWAKVVTWFVSRSSTFLDEVMNLPVAGIISIKIASNSNVPSDFSPLRISGKRGNASERTFNHTSGRHPPFFASVASSKHFFNLGNCSFVEAATRLVSSTWRRQNFFSWRAPWRELSKASDPL